VILIPLSTFGAYLLLIGAVGFGLLALTFVVMSDGESDIEDPTLDTRGPDDR
jgi:hypothetical protein